MSGSRRVWRLLPSAIVVGALFWVGGTWWSVRSYRTAMTAIEAAMAAGRFGLAARDLEILLASRPGSDECAYVLGLCEQARRRTQAADAAWARVSPGSRFTQRAILGRLRLFHGSGRLADAERLIVDAAADPRNDRTDMLVLLVPIYSQIGRSDEAERLIEARWEHLRQTGAATREESIKLVRLHIELTWKAPSVESLRLFLDQAGQVAPNDDRGWLGRANLAIQTGDTPEAKRWLDACLQRRPDDVPVWRAWLNWGIATGRIDTVEQALKHLPAADSSPAQVHRLRAWICSRRNDAGCERPELERLVAADPADLSAFERLAQLQEKDGPRSPAPADELTRKKADIERLRTRYQSLYDRTQPIRDAEEMARIAEQLGREFEARVFLTLAVSEEPEREELRRDLERLMRRQAAFVPGSRTLSEIVMSP